MKKLIWSLSLIIALPVLVLFGVQLLPNIDHMGVVSVPEALEAVVAAVQKNQN